MHVMRTALKFHSTRFAISTCSFDENTARYYFRQLIKGVKYCHSQGMPAGTSQFIAVVVAVHCFYSFWSVR